MTKLRAQFEKWLKDERLKLSDYDAQRLGVFVRNKIHPGHYLNRETDDWWIAYQAGYWDGYRKRGDEV